MVNPYLELMRVVTQKRLSADKLLQQQGNTLSGAPPRAGLGDEEDCAGAGWRPPHSIDPTATKAAEHNSISFGKWFFFCQHCRHGGHANCIDQWFGGTGNASSEPILCSPVSAKAATGSAIAPVKRVVCGVNGCDCKCVARL